MSNKELEDAIVMARTMFNNTANDNPAFPLLFEHLRSLLVEQLRRARAAE